jgi:zinc transport system ATP-binding protein
MLQHLIDIKDLSFSYEKDKVLENINLTVSKKDFLAIIGPNGGGKSTLLKIILGIYRNYNGTIQVLNKLPFKSSSLLGYVPQNTNININFPISVLEAVLMGYNEQKKEQKTLWNTLFNLQYNKNEINFAKSILEKVGMGDFLYEKISSLSGGERQRIMIARALCINPQILILDEPTANIDLDGQNKIYNLLQELNKTISIIIVSHDISFVFEYVNKVAYVNKSLTFHDISNSHKLSNKSEHFCEVEMFELMKKEHKC